MHHHHLFPIGVVLPYAGPLADSENTSTVNVAQIAANLAKDGWLFCDGSLLSIAAYRHLHGVIGIAFGGDKVSFRLPDLRGRFIRGVSGNPIPGEKCRDPDVLDRTPSDAGKTGHHGNMVGSLQTDAFQGHEHDYQGVSASVLKKTLGPGEEPAFGLLSEATTAEETQKGDDTPRVSSETRPANLYLNYIIRYR